MSNREEIISIRCTTEEKNDLYMFINLIKANTNTRKKNISIIIEGIKHYYFSEIADTKTIIHKRNK